MTATNHVLTGVVVASVLSNPLVALPAAFLSHFVLDAVPHYGDKYLGLNSFKFKLILGSDIYMASMILLLVLFLSPENMWVVFFAGVLAASPDLMWLPDFIAALRHQPAQEKTGMLRGIHSRVQWYQKPAGAYIEIAWFIVAFIVAFGVTI